MIISSREDADGFDLPAAYVELGGQVFGFALNGLGDRGAAEDCVQETFLRAWRARDRYRGDLGSPRTWVFAIARNVVTDLLRARARQPGPVREPDRETRPESARAGDHVPPPAVEERLVILAALAQLTPEHREVVAAVQLDGLSYQQLADRTGIAVGTLRTRMFYALKALRALLQEGGDHD